ncbi:hypothetical protein GCM10009584_11890 [Ornithinimicrobium humiphilum]|uniref:Uncharacterized protein n=1 Tax=Ornithinimicrobium humiphilum TaxID=125288 RepID=A0A543KJN0_9MICO|nr:hypothetical protein [Ornithinimicrobium humiphilum]TQM95292.1 hypothetical protein FB476_0131 [Ornithinimicrobium humiphilum]
MTPLVQRLLGTAILLVTGIFSLPVVAYFLDGPGTEDWILPVQLVLMAAIGAGCAVGLPALAPAGAARGRRALVGVGWGLLAALVGVLLFWFLLNGLRGA